MQKTNFDQYLDRKMIDPEFRQKFQDADRAWDIALQLVALRKARGLTQQQVADLLGTKQQAIARLEDPSYAGHSLSMIRKYAEALGATVQVTITPEDGTTSLHRLPNRPMGDGVSRKSGHGPLTGGGSSAISAESSTPTCGFCAHKPHLGVLTPR